MQAGGTRPSLDPLTLIPVALSFLVGWRVGFPATVVALVALAFGSTAGDLSGSVVSMWVFTVPAWVMGQVMRSRSHLSAQLAQRARELERRARGVRTRGGSLRTSTDRARSARHRGAQSKPDRRPSGSRSPRLARAPRSPGGVAAAHRGRRPISQGGDRSARRPARRRRTRRGRRRGASPPRCAASRSREERALDHLLVRREPGPGCAEARGGRLPGDAGGDRQRAQARSRLVDPGRGGGHQRGAIRYRREHRADRYGRSIGDRRRTLRPRRAARADRGAPGDAGRPADPNRRMAARGAPAIAAATCSTPERTRRPSVQSPNPSGKATQNHASTIARHGRANTNAGRPLRVARAVANRKCQERVLCFPSVSDRQRSSLIS